MPAVVTAQSSLPSLITSQPAVATIPAGLLTGINTVAIGNSTTVLVSVGSSTTSVLGGSYTSVVASSSKATSSAQSASGSAASASASASASSTESSGAEARSRVATGGLVGALAFFLYFM